jgi:hypothetical protein
MTEGATIRDRNRLMEACWNAVYFLKGETETHTEGPLPTDPEAGPVGKGTPGEETKDFPPGAAE